MASKIIKYLTEQTSSSVVKILTDLRDKVHQPIYQEKKIHKVEEVVLWQHASAVSHISNISTQHMKVIYFKAIL